MISRHPAFRARDCACPFSFGAQYQFPDRFYIRGPPHPLQFRFIPSFFAHPPRKRSSSVLLSYVLALDFLFSSGGVFFFLTTSHSSPQTPIVKSTLPRTDTPFVRVLHTPPSKHPSSPTPPLPHHPLIPSHPFFLFRPAQRPVPWESTSDHLARGVSNEGQRDKPQALHVWKIQFRFFLRYSGVCPRTPYRDDVLAPYTACS